MIINNAMPAISFVMLTWNRKNFVEQMFSSFYKNLSNNFDYEFLVIDNGSNDGTMELLKGYAEKDSSIKACFNDKNKGLNEYKKLFSKIKGEYIVIIDDDVIEFPFAFDKIMVDYIQEFKDFGFISLDVVQNEYTEGAKPELKFYIDVARGDKTISEGPAGGWCAIFRRKDYRKIKILFYLTGKLTMKKSEDGMLCALFQRVLGLKRGVIKDLKCLHACGPYYSKLFGYLDRDIEKYKISNLDKIADIYSEYKEK